MQFNHIKTAGFLLWKAVSETLAAILLGSARHIYGSILLQSV
jgi:hypothetical protein